MNNEIEALTRQFQILDEEQSKLPAGPQKTALQKAAGAVKNKLVIKLNEKTAPNKPESKTPGTEYWENGNSVIDEYFNNLTPDMERYFTTREDLFDGAPSMSSPLPPTSDDEEERRKLRQRILRAVGC
ncbi:TPA: hypothetical protein OHP72_000712 [Escherichia coli]|nr:hypothetical protein [Escherichia coli]